jgi:TRAP-type C4-dicarboxylate transport system substrate-binding protein
MDKAAGGDLGDRIEARDRIEKAGVRPIAYFARGPRNLTANREITVAGPNWRPEDARAERAAVR